MPAPKPPAFETLSLHAGQHPDPVTRSRAVPIYQTTSYVFDDADHAAGLFNLERAGHIYTRISNPTTAVLEERLAALEDGVGAVCTASGMAAMHLAIATLLNSGDHIVASASLYGGSINLLTHTLPRFGITTTFVKPRDLDGFRAAIGDRTRLIIGETIGNPGLEVLDIPKVADIAHAAGIPLLVDNTFASPYLSRPLTLGVDIVWHSITKWIGGHGIAIGGVVVDGGRFDWQASAKFPTLTEPVCRLSRHRLCRGVRPDRLYHAGAGRRLARLRRLSVADQRLSSAAGTGDAAAAHGTACGKHRGRRGGFEQTSRGRLGAASFARNRIRITRWRRSCCRRALARS